MEKELSDRARLLLVQVRRPDDPLIEHELECMAARLAGCGVDVYPRNVVVGDIPAQILREYDFFVVGGSGDFSVHHPRSAHWVSQLRGLYDSALTLQIPSFGICFGHQVLGKHFGSEVRTGSEGAEAGTVKLQLTPEGRDDAIFSTLGASFGAHTGHSDYVVETPPGLELLAKNAHLDTQVFRVQGAPFYSTQFHPDLQAGEARYRYELFARAKAEKSHTTDSAPTINFDSGEDSISGLLARFVRHFSG